MHHAQSSSADVTAANANTVTRSADLATKMCTTSRCSSGYRRSERVTGSCQALVRLWREGVDLWVATPTKRRLPRIDSRGEARHHLNLIKITASQW